MTTEQQQNIPMTPYGHSKLVAELDQLIKEDREKIKEAISQARALGDLKENAEYHSAKEKQSLIEGKILELQHIITKAKIVDVASIVSDKVVFGATLVVLDIDKDKENIFQIVGPNETDSTLGKISYSSPIAKAFMGKKVGDTAIVKAPKGDIEYEILKIEYK